MEANRRRAFFMIGISSTCVRMGICAVRATVTVRPGKTCGRENWRVRAADAFSGAMPEPGERSGVEDTEEEVDAG